MQNQLLFPDKFYFQEMLFLKQQDSTTSSYFTWEKKIQNPTKEFIRVILETYKNQWSTWGRKHWWRWPERNNSKNTNPEFSERKAKGSHLWIERWNWIAPSILGNPQSVTRALILEVSWCHQKSHGNGSLLTNTASYTIKKNPTCQWYHGKTACFDIVPIFPG